MRELKDKDEQYQAYLRYKNNQSADNTGEGVVKALGVIVIGIVCAVLFFNAVILHPRVNTAGLRTESIFEKFTRKDKKPFSIPFFSKRQNILVLGVDSNGANTDKFKGTRSDTILLVNIDPATHSINAISIPRDSKVYLANSSHSAQKINHAHALGGIDLTKKTIEKTLGVKIDRYIVINTEGVSEMVDAIGGVPVYVEKTLNYDDYAGKLHIHLEKGEHVLSGVEAEGFLRFRHDGLGDIGRTSRQQWFIKNLLETLKTPAIIPKIPEALKIANKNVKTDMTLYEMSHLAALARNINPDAVEVATLPGRPSEKSTISYWILDPEKVQEVIDRLIYRIKQDEADKLSAGIRYTASKEDIAMSVKDKLEELGYNVNCVDRGRVTHSQIIAHEKTVSSELISKLKRKIPEIKRMQFVYDTNRNYCAQSDFTIIISE